MHLITDEGGGRSCRPETRSSSFVSCTQLVRRSAQTLSQEDKLTADRIALNPSNSQTKMASGFEEVTPSADYSAMTEYNDYETENSELCVKSSVREFRGYYEPPLFWMIFVVGAVGNLMVTWIYVHMRNRLKTMTDVYLLNLAIADLLFLGTLPFLATDATTGWIFGSGLCRVVLAIYKINFFSSMLLLTCISVDRYIAIVQATKAQNLKSKRLFYSKVVCVGVWLLSGLLTIPEFLFSQVKTVKDRSFCTLVFWSNQNNITKILVLSLQICMGFCLPFLIMIFCYAVIIRTLLQAKNFEKHKALRVIFAVVAVFVLSQLPYNSMLVMEAAQAANATQMACEVSHHFDIASQVLKSLAYTHSCLNPILYAFIGVRFRRDLLGVLRVCTPGLGHKSAGKQQGDSKRPSVMSDTDTTPVLSL
ncbi:C-C chemokine receptor type 9-like [Arapaima gigas]